MKTITMLRIMFYFLWLRKDFLVFRCAYGFLRFSPLCGGRRVLHRLDRPNGQVAAAVADEVHPIIYRPERREVRAISIGEPSAAGAVGIDYPKVLLALSFVSDDGCEGQLFAVGAPGWMHDRGIAA